MSLLDVVFGVSVALLGLEQGRSLTRALQLRFENLDLAEDLKFQKDRAETANAAKTSFLAAASHDLRQPLHALGMFVAALGGRRMDPGARRLTRQITDSVVAMNGLFDALLDVSQLDAGVVRPRSDAPFPIQPLMTRICRDYAPDAEAKGVALIGAPLLAQRAYGRRSSGTGPPQPSSPTPSATPSTAASLSAAGAGARLKIGVWDTGPGHRPPSTRKASFRNSSGGQSGAGPVQGSWPGSGHHQTGRRPDRLSHRSAFHARQGDEGHRLGADRETGAETGAAEASQSPMALAQA